MLWVITMKLNKRCLTLIPYRYVKKYNTYSHFFFFVCLRWS